MPSGVKDIQLLELKDTISQLNKTISTQNELISSLQKMLEERNAKDSEKDLLIANLQSQLAYLKNKVFGSTSEIRHDQLDGQLNLFGTPVGDEKPAEVIEPEVISVKGYTKERKPKATYDDKYNSVRSICKHFFTDIVGLSIKFFCVSLRHMSILFWHEWKSPYARTMFLQWKDQGRWIPGRFPPYKTAQTACPPPLHQASKHDLQIAGSRPCAGRSEDLRRCILLHY